jgi:hypothetical protein
MSMTPLYDGLPVGSPTYSSAFALLTSGDIQPPECRKPTGGGGMTEADPPGAVTPAHPDARRRISVAAATVCVVKPPRDRLASG